MLRVIVAAALLAFLGPTCTVAADPPPWAVESPAAAGDGARFGLGLDSFFEKQKSLRIRSQQSVTLLQGPDGLPLPMIVNGDAELLNRKFDLEWELRGAGVQVPLALSCFRLTDLVRVFPTVTFEASMADITLNILDKPEPGFSTSLQGRGPLFGTNIGVTATLGGAWFAGTTYHYRSLPSLAVDRSPGFAAPGFEVLHDEVRLSQEIHEVSTKAGYVTADGKTAYYTGVRARQTDVEIEDELRLRDGIFGRETELNSRSKLGSEVVQAVVGVDRHLRGPLFARTEATFGDQDYGVMVTIAYVMTQNKDLNDAKFLDHMRGIAAALAPQIALVLADFRARWGTLKVVDGPGGAPSYKATEVFRLLLGAEGRLLDALNLYPELEPLVDWVRDRFQESREALEAEMGAAETPVRSVLKASTNRSAQSWPNVLRSRWDPILATKDQEISMVKRKMEGGELAIKVTFSSSLRPKSSLAFRPKRDTKGISKAARKIGASYYAWVIIGTYSYQVLQNGKLRFECDARTPLTGNEPCPVDLVNNPSPVFACSDDLGCGYQGSL